MTPKEARGILAAEAAGLAITPKQKHESHQLLADGLTPDDSPAPSLSWRQLIARCTEEGDCLLWNQGLVSSGYPQARIDGRSQLVARYVYVHLLGKELRKGYVLTTRCGNKLCLAPCCLMQITYSERMRRSYASGARSTATEYASRQRRAVEQGIAKCSLEIAEDIRANRMHVPSKQLAAELGVGRTAVDDMKAGRTWRRPLPANSVFNLGAHS